jgi:hypothetical protein
MVYEMKRKVSAIEGVVFVAAVVILATLCLAERRNAAYALDAGDRPNGTPLGYLGSLRSLAEEQWVIETVDSNDVQPKGTSLVLDANGNPHIL